MSDEDCLATGDAQVDGRSLAQEAYEKYREWKYEAFPADEPHPRNRTSWAELDPREQDVWRSVVTLIATAERLAVQRSEAAQAETRTDLDKMLRAMLDTALAGEQTMATVGEYEIMMRRADHPSEAAKLDPREGVCVVCGVTFGPLRCVQHAINASRTADSEAAQAAVPIAERSGTRDLRELLQDVVDETVGYMPESSAEVLLAVIRKALSEGETAKCERDELREKLGSADVQKEPYSEALLRVAVAARELHEAWFDHVPLTNVNDATLGLWSALDALDRAPEQQRRESAQKSSRHVGAHEAPSHDEVGTADSNSAVPAGLVGIGGTTSAEAEAVRRATLAAHNPEAAMSERSAPSVDPDAGTPWPPTETEEAWTARHKGHVTEEYTPDPTCESRSLFCHDCDEEKSWPNARYLREHPPAPNAGLAFAAGVRVHIVDGLNVGGRGTIVRADGVGFWLVDIDGTRQRRVRGDFLVPFDESGPSSRAESELFPLAVRIEKGRQKYPTGCTLLSLLDEAGEVAHAVNKRESHERVRDELLDVAAVAMRLYFGEIDTAWQPSAPFTSPTPDGKP